MTLFGLDFSAPRSVSRPVTRVGGAMDEDLIETAVEALEGLIGQLVEEAHDDAVARAPESIEARTERLAVLSVLGTDLTVLADAAAILLRRRRN